MQGKKNSGKILAMYDIRGIQSFIFRTNKAREIMGASRLVEHIIESALMHGLEEAGIPEEQYILTWEDDGEIRILSDETILAQVLFIGGGNAYVIYRDRALAVEINRKMARYVLDETYSLQLAVAMVEKTESYAADYQNVQNEMARIKASMPYSGCLGAPSVVAVDDMSGFPCSIDGMEKLKGKREYGGSISYESIRKLASYYEHYKKEGEERIHDNLITQYGKESILAVVHIDGNNMGMRIRALMEGERDYAEAVKKMRTISKNINHCFKDTFEKTVGYIRRWVESSANDILKKEADGKRAQYIRKILVAGDDITFVCNARLALPIIKYFTQDISGKVMFGEPTDENIEKYGFSVCAGAAYVHSHFPFRSAYDVAEACCSSAKKRAKTEENKFLTDSGEERIGNWVDFQICKSVHNIDLEKSRRKNYTLSERERLLRRPYYLEINRPSYAEFNRKNERYSYTGFERIMDYFKYNADMPRSLAKEFRNTYPLGRNAVEELVEFAHSRKKLGGELEDESLSGAKENPGFVELDGKCTAAWYDALEMMDYYIRLEQKTSGGEEA